ncbi:hypothetical protein DL98DRAFT_10543 [Cadophora sp. DSE1049]|nr:hypothetical protein DL98DRAFT_10543 [Cadophora sp. DSE1049]
MRIFSAHQPPNPTTHTRTQNCLYCTVLYPAVLLLLYHPQQKYHPPSNAFHRRLSTISGSLAAVLQSVPAQTRSPVPCGY